MTTLAFYRVKKASRWETPKKRLELPGASRPGVKKLEKEVERALLELVPVVCWKPFVGGTLKSSPVFQPIAKGQRGHSEKGLFRESLVSTNLQTSGESRDSEIGFPPKWRRRYTPPCRSPGCSTVVEALSAVSSVSQECCSYTTPKGPVAPHPGTPCRASRPPKPCRAPRGGAATLASVALHFDTEFPTLEISRTRTLLKRPLFQKTPSSDAEPSPWPICSARYREFNGKCMSQAYVTCS